ncbi:Serine/arginine repetitive matrix protein [Actinidia chinensis var. chinensis]|uniref:Serine/arginine repetitive matrix protein n=1 Tax=Actinidia chinensis var. chinensis TaxID=1590841 RepID=A0A2R6PM89_ACTCC|nr:Serine/arginine repetitive matrix protein [Actinidia chinensis var. chinensis]
MPVAKLRANSTPDAMKSLEGNDSIDTFIRQAIGKEPFLSYPRTVDPQVQWVQLLQALEQPDLPGWPLLSPLKIQMQKCEKCSREFCSPINYRRHIRVHRRSLNVDKESHKSRDLLGAFWDKISLDEAKEIVSFKDVTLEEVTGPSIVKTLTTLVRKAGFCPLPQAHVRAGSALLDIVQARPSRLPVSSQELFSILDDASEKTFLCAGTAESMQKYVFDGEAGKIGLEVKNLVACTSFLLEQKLVKAWVADKDAEALRCQKLLVEEEEAAQKRQAELLERKRQKKLRQKEQKVKEQANGEKADFRDVPADALDSPSAGTSSTLIESESSSNALETPPDHASTLLEPVQMSITEGDTDTEAQYVFSCEHSDLSTFPFIDRRTGQGNGRRHLVISRRQVPKSQKTGRNGCHSSQNPQVLKLEPTQKHGAPGDPWAAAVNGNKVWTRKPKSENDGESLKSRLLKGVVNQTDQNKNSEVMIGSISVMLGNCTAQQQGDGLPEAQEHRSTEHSMSKSNGQEKPTKTDSLQGGLNKSTVKLWRPVSRHETRGPMPVRSGSGESEEDVITGKSNDRMADSERCLRSCGLGDSGYESGNNSHPLVNGRVHPDSLPFSSHVARAFLAQRWKEAIASDHVKLVLTPEFEPPGCPDTESDDQVVTQSSDPHRRSILGNAENLLANVGAFDSSTTETVKAKFRIKPEKSISRKYIPKQSALT